MRPEMIEVRRQRREQEWKERAPARADVRAQQEAKDLAYAQTIPEDVEDLTTEHIMYRQAEGRGPAFVSKEQANRYLNQSQERDAAGRLLRPPLDPKIQSLLTYTAIHGPKPTAAQSEQSMYNALDAGDVLSGGMVGAGDVERIRKSIATKDVGLGLEGGIGLIPLIGTAAIRTPPVKRLIKKVGGKAKTKLATHIEKKAVDPQLRYRAAQTLEEGRMTPHEAKMEEAFGSGTVKPEDIRGQDPRLSVGDVEPRIPLEASGEDVTALNLLAKNAPPQRMEDEAIAFYEQLSQIHVRSRKRRQDVERKALRSLMIDPNFKLSHEIQMVLDVKAKRIPHHRLGDVEKQIYAAIRNDDTMEDMLHSLWASDLLEFRRGEVVTGGNIIKRGQLVKISPYSESMRASGQIHGYQPGGGQTFGGVDAFVELVDVSPKHIATELRDAITNAKGARSRVLKQKQAVMDIKVQRAPVRQLQQLEEQRKLGLGGEIIDPDSYERDMFGRRTGIPIQHKPYTRSSPRHTQAKRPVEIPGLQDDLDNKAKLFIDQFDGAVIPTSPTVSAQNHILTLLDSKETFKDPIFRSLAGKVANHPLLETASFTEVAKVPGMSGAKGWGGIYSPTHHSILLPDRLADYPQTVVHEGMHAITAGTWREGRKLRQQLKSGDTVFENLSPIETRTLRFFDELDDLALQVEQRAKSSRHPSLPDLVPQRRLGPGTTRPAGLDPVQSAEGLDYHYGGYNSEEFLSEVMNNKEFRMMLKDTTYVTPTGPMGAYDKFLNMLANLMGFSKKEVDVLFQSMESIDELMQTNLNLPGLKAVPEYKPGFSPVIEPPG